MFGKLTLIHQMSEDTVLGQISQKHSENERSKQQAIKQAAGMNYQGLLEWYLHKWLESTTLHSLNVYCALPKMIQPEFTITAYDEGGVLCILPDIDICIWDDVTDRTSPVIMLSAKSSLRDRAGSAARWKNELTTLGIQRPYVYALVTANNDTEIGELDRDQCRKNTYMFEHKFTTRDDEQQVMFPGWKIADKLPVLVETVFNDGIPATPRQKYRLNFEDD